MLFRFVSITPSDRHDILVADERRSPFQVGDDDGSPARGQSKVHRRRLAGGLGLRLVEVGVTIEEQETIPADAPEREQVAEQDRAVSAEDDGECATVQSRANRIGQFNRKPCDRVWIEEECFGIPARVIGRWYDAASVPGFQHRCQSRVQERVGECFHAFWKKA